MITGLIATNNFKDIVPMSFRDETPIKPHLLSITISCQLKTEIFSQFYTDKTFSP